MKEEVEWTMVKRRSEKDFNRHQETYRLCSLEREQRERYGQIVTERNYERVRDCEYIVKV